MSGAIHSITGIYTLPSEAYKEDVYVCLCHNEPLIVRQGEKNIHHYAHFPNANANSNGQRLTYVGGETIAHIDAKHILHNHIVRKQPLTIVKRCYCCEDTEEHIIPTQDATEVCLEKVIGNGSRVDVHMRTPTTSYCFEVYYSSRSDMRPEPFYELHSEHIRQDMTTLIDMRSHMCADCKEKQRVLALEFERNKQEAIKIALINHQKVLNNVIFLFGKYKNQRVKDVIKINPEYCVWILDQPPKVGNFLDVQDYLRSRLKKQP